MRGLALTLSRHQLLQADTLDRYMVLMLRARLSGAELRGMSGHDLLRLSVDRGWVGSNMPSGMTVKRVVDDTAYITLMKDGSAVPGEFPFMKRIENRWRVDVLGMTRLTRPALLQMFSQLANAYGTDVNEAIIVVIAKLIGTKPPDSIWDPPS